ncbi:MAG: T9SS type A sorting domain-containing protein, partial [Candidatus Marinimicrobia bacterium]|nr:T9SS type A sorting domain-containing protein [Candidatus Neomarinimicrobiota bacterium]
NAALSTSETPCSITLTSFIANAKHGKVNLAWTTATETENSHFLIYRDNEVIASVAGNGTTTESHDYTYTDVLVEADKVYKYVLADVSFGGIENKFAPVMIEIREEMELRDFVLNKAYPNPFNPTTVISMHYAVGSNAIVNIYNTQGVLVEELVNDYVKAGDYELTWDAAGMPSGVYIVKMHAGNVMQSQKIVLMK